MRSSVKLRHERAHSLPRLDELHIKSTVSYRLEPKQAVLVTLPSHT